MIYPSAFQKGGLNHDRTTAYRVLTWWGHLARSEVSDEIVDRVQERVLEGMDLVIFYSGHHSKIFKRLMGTTCNLRWREAGEEERLWNVEPGYPAALDIDEYFELPHEETYPSYYDASVMKIITNAVRWARPRITPKIDCPNAQPIENLNSWECGDFSLESLLFGREPHIGQNGGLNLNG